MNYAKARYNMIFDNGKFYKNKVYQYKKKLKEKQIICITEEQKNQVFWEKDFKDLFFILKKEQ